MGQLPYICLANLYIFFVGHNNTQYQQFVLPRKDDYSIVKYAYAQLYTKSIPYFTYVNHMYWFGYEFYRIICTIDTITKMKMGNYFCTELQHRRPFCHGVRETTCPVENYGISVCSTDVGITIL